MKRAPLFILGAPRSGTTLLASLFKDSPYGAPIETRFITKYYKMLWKYGDLENKSNFNCLISDIINERYVQQWNVDYDIDEVWMNCPNKTYSEICDYLISKRFKNIGKDKWGDKTPPYTFDLDVLKELFPQALYIYIVRDGRDVALSLLKQNWGPNNVLCCAEYWNRSNNIDSQIEDLKKSDRLYEIKYEELLSEPRLHIKRLYEFISFDYEESYVSKIIEKLNTDNIYNWKREMRERDVKVFQCVSGVNLQKFNYQIIDTKFSITPLEKTFWQIHNKGLRFFELIRLNTIEWFKIKYLGKEPFGE